MERKAKTPGGWRMPAAAAVRLRSELAGVADEVIDAVIAEVPAYRDAWEGPMGETIRGAVQLALGGFISLVSDRRGTNASTPNAPAVDGAYQLGRGEARSGRTNDALLSAYRIGARVAWRRMSALAVEAGMDAENLASFAELVFAYIDELSAASVAGHSDELTTSGRLRQRRLERVAQHLLNGAPESTVLPAAERAEWQPPRTLTALIVPEAQVRPVLAEISPHTLQAADPPGLEDGVVLLVPDAHGRSRRSLLRTIRSRSGVAGPARPWLQVRTSYERALRAELLGLTGDTDEHLVELVLRADAAALADLREQALAPLADLRPATAEKLVETLRAWLLHHGRREQVAAELFVHPQTVRYRLTQLRDVYGDRLDDPETVRLLTVALAVTSPQNGVDDAAVDDGDGGRGGG